MTVCLPSQDFICEHYGEDSSLYDKEIKELMELRQVNKCTHTTSYKPWSSLVLNLFFIKGVEENHSFRKKKRKQKLYLKYLEMYMSESCSLQRLSVCLCVVWARPCVHPVVTRPAWSYWWSITTSCTTWTSASSLFTGTWACTSTGRTWALLNVKAWRLKNFISYSAVFCEALRLNFVSCTWSHEQPALWLVCSKSHPCSARPVLQPAVLPVCCGFLVLRLVYSRWNTWTLKTLSLYLESLSWCSVSENLVTFDLF